MSSQSEQPKTSLEDLVARNAEGLGVMAEPYMVTMVPIQEKHWDTMMSLLQQTVEFQPEMLEAFQTLATREDLSGKINLLTRSSVAEMKKTGEAILSESRTLKTENENIRHSILNQLSQDGKNREQFFKDTQAEFIRLSSRTMTKSQKIWLWIKVSALILYPWLSALALRLLLR